MIHLKLVTYEPKVHFGKNFPPDVRLYVRNNILATLRHGTVPMRVYGYQC